MKRNRMRSGFSMLTAIAVIVIMGTIGAFVMSLGGKIVKTTATQYQHEQAILYAKSYTEFAVMAVTGNDRVNKECIDTINGQVDNYQIRVELSYIGPTSVIGNCSSDRQLSTNVKTKKTPLTVIIDTFVQYPDIDSNQKFTVHRRTVQKI